MRLCVRAAAFLLLLLPVAAAAESSFDGAWAGHVDSDAGPLILFMIQTADGKLTGTVAEAGAKLTIDEGTATDDTLTFTSTQKNDDGSTMAISCTGTLKGDAIAMTCQTAGQPEKSFVVKRQKAT